MNLMIKNDKLDHILYINRVCFKIAFMVTMLLCAVPYIHGILSPYVKLLLVWGGASVAADLITGAKLVRNKFTGLLLAFCACYGVTCLLNRELNFGSNVKALIYMEVIFLLLYGHDLAVDPEKVKQEMRVLSYVFVGISFVLSLICFLTYALSIDFHYNSDNGWMYIGMFENRLWGLYNPNTGSTLGTLSVILSTFLFFTREKKRKWVAAFHIVNVCIQCFCLILTNSRTALYVLYIAVAMLVFYLIPFKWLRERNFKNYALRVLAALLAVICLLGTFKAIKYGLSYVPSVVSSIVSTDSQGEDFELEREELDRIENIEDRPGGILTGRVDLWEASLGTIKESPIFGVGRENLAVKTEKFLKDDIWVGTLKTGGLHNIYLTVLTSSGIVGFAILAIFAVWTVTKMLIALYKKQFTGKERYWFICAFVLVAIFAVMEMFEGRILYQVNIFYLIFWIYYGYAMYFTQKFAPAPQKKAE